MSTQINFIGIILLITQTVNCVQLATHRRRVFTSSSGNTLPDLHSLSPQAQELFSSYNMSTIQGRKQALDAYMYLHNELGRKDWLPLDLNFGRTRGNSVPRHVIDNIFLPMIKEKYRLKGPKCIEWASARYLVGDTIFKDICTEPYVIDFKKLNCGGEWGSFEGTHYNGFCADIHESEGVIPNDFIDLVLATQVFEHLYNPFKAAKNIYNMTRPGGIMVLSVPKISIFHGVPNHYFGYTVQGIRVVLEQAGFCVEQVNGLESSFVCASHLLGFSSGDINPEEYNEKDDIAPCTIGVVARKPEAGESCEEKKFIDANSLNKFRKGWGYRVSGEIKSIQ